MSSWLTIIGIGEDGAQGLCAKAQDALKNAEIVYGGNRHFALVRQAIQGEKRYWPKQFLSAIDDIKRLKGRNVVVLASGDPLFHGVGNSLVEHFDPNEITFFYHPSSFHLALQRLGWSAQTTNCISLLGQPINSLKSHIQKTQKLIILAPDVKSLPDIITVFEQQKASKTQFVILENLGGPAEKISPFLTLDQVKQYQTSNLYVIAAKCEGECSQTYPLGTVLPDFYFENDGQLTKHNIRAITLSYLTPHTNQLLWDIGAGSGSISIEWLRAAPKTRAFALEKNINRANRIHENAKNIGVVGLTVFEGNAIDIIKELETPDAVFIGGGFTDATLAEDCWNALKVGGKFVANGVTLETESAFQMWVKHHGGELIKLSIARAEPLGDFHIWRQSLPVTILIATKK